MSEEEYFTQHHNDNTDLLLLGYSERFETPYFNIEDTGVTLTDTELRADLLHCLYHNKPKDHIDQPSRNLIALALAD